MSHDNEDMNVGDEDENNEKESEANGQKPEKMFTLKKWNAVAMWSWDVECDTCAICRVQVMGEQCVINFKESTCIIVLLISSLCCVANIGKFDFEAYLR